MPMVRKRLGEILIAKNLITLDQLQECLEEQKFTREYIGAILLKKRLITQEALAKALSQQFDILYISLKNFYVDWNVCLRFSTLVTAQENALPIRADDTAVTVAISDPLDVIGVEKLEEMARPKKIKLVLVTPQELKEFILECKRRTKGPLKSLLEKE